MGLNNRNIDTINVTVYSYIMTQREKLILRAMNNPADLSFDDLRTLWKASNKVILIETNKCLYPHQKNLIVDNLMFELINACIKP